MRKCHFIAIGVVRHASPGGIRRGETFPAVRAAATRPSADQTLDRRQSERYNHGLSRCLSECSTEPITFTRGPTIADASAKPDSSQRSLQLAMAAARTAEENRGQDIVVLDMREITPVFDYFVIATGNSRRQLHAISEEIEHVLQEQLKDKRMGIEGYDESRWILLDYGNVVVHLFDQETREFYALEDFWSEAKRLPLPWDPPADPAVDETAGNARPGA